jgi:hypothetical protein
VSEQTWRIDRRPDPGTSASPEPRSRDDALKDQVTPGLFCITRNTTARNAAIGGAVTRSVDVGAIGKQSLGVRSMEED